MDALALVYMIIIRNYASSMMMILTTQFGHYAELKRSKHN
nr:MAG TPA: hypothetical protein [Caudoviricetes sp.]